MRTVVEVLLPDDREETTLYNLAAAAQKRADEAREAGVDIDPIEAGTMYLVSLLMTHRAFMRMPEGDVREIELELLEA